MQNGKIVVVWLFQKYEGRSFYATGVMSRLNSPSFSTTAVYLAKLSDAPNPLEESGCRAVYLASKGATKMFNPVLVWKLAKFLKQNKVDILHCHRHKAALYGILAARIAKTQVIFVHVHGLNRTSNILRRIENHFLFGKVNKVIAISEAVRGDVGASNPTLPSEKVITIKNSIDFEKFADVNIPRQQARQMLGLPEDAFVFGTVGRLVSTKGQSFLIEAFAKVRQSIPKAHLVFAGDGRLESKLKQQAVRLGCLDVITFAGLRNDIPQVLRAFDCFVFPSIAEGLPGALLEAMAASLPCIASAVGGIPEVLNDKKLGYLVPAKNVDALAVTMLECASKSQQERRLMGQAARDTVEKLYSDEVVVANLEKLYKEELCKTARR
jgi:glycosyltransferase involved in cell wall biosynthesis